MVPDRRRRSHTRLVAAVAVLQGLVLAFFYLPAGLVVPPGGYVILNSVGIALTLAAVSAARGGRRIALACPVATIVFWVVFVSAGAALFDWTA